MGEQLQVFFASRGISHQRTVPHTPQQNGRAERFNQTLLEKAEAMRHHACLPNIFWQDAVETALHIYNRQPMRRHQWKTPVELFYGKQDDKPDVSYFRVFGCRAYVFIPPEQRANKLAPKAEEMIFIGYEPNTKGWHFWSQIKHRVVISTHATFDETFFPCCLRKEVDKLPSIPPLPHDDEEQDHIANDDSRPLDDDDSRPSPSYSGLPDSLGIPHFDPSDDRRTSVSPEPVTPVFRTPPSQHLPLQPSPPHPPPLERNPPVLRPPQVR